MDQFKTDGLIYENVWINGLFDIKMDRSVFGKQTIQR